MSQGNLPLATHYAKGAMKLSSRTWARLDRYARKKTDQPAPSAVEGGIDTITDGIATINLTPTAVSEPDEIIKGSIFWPHFASHFGALVHLSRMAALNGLFQDAVYYGEQALELGKSIGSRYFTSLIRAELANFHICGDQIQKGEEFLLKAAQDSETLDRHLASVALDIYRSRKYQRSGRPDDANAVIGATSEVLLWISQSSFVESLDPFKVMTVADISRKMEDISLRPRSQTSSRPTRQTKPPAGKRAERGASRTKKPSHAKVESKPDSSIFSSLHVELACRQAESALARGKVSDAGSMLDKASNFDVSRLNEVDLSICRAEYLLASAMSSLSSHGVYCVLRESTISLPSVYITEDRTVETSSKPSHRKAKPTSCARGAKLAARSTRKDAPVLGDESGSLLLSAKASLQQTSALSVVSGSTQNNHNISFLLGRISMLANATTSHGPSAPDSLVPAYTIGELTP
jgi:separase